MPKKVYTIEQREFIWDSRREDNWSPSELLDNWEDYFSEAIPTYYSINEILKTIDHWIGSREEYLDWYRVTKHRRYSNEENEWLALKETIKLRGNFKSLAKAWHDEFGYDRPITAIRSKICTITGQGNQLEQPHRSHNVNPDFSEAWLKGVHPTLTLVPGQTYTGFHSTYMFTCVVGHLLEKDSPGSRFGCGICAANHVGGLPRGPQPALVYLLIFLEWKKCKLGYAEIGSSLSPEEAIHRTSQSRGYPYPYIIGAYDLSTKTEAGELEERLLIETKPTQVFVEKQEFHGYTEFRTWETIEELKKKKVFKTWL